MLYAIWAQQIKDSFLRIFQYITFRSGAAIVIAILTSFFLAPLVIKMLTRRNIGEKIRADGPKNHHKKAGTPTMGGLVIIGSAMLSILICGNWSNDFVLIVTLSMLAFGVLGFIDDYLKATHPSNKGLNAAVKFGGQILIATGVGVYIFLTPNISISLPYEAAAANINNTTLFIPFVKEVSVNLGWLYIPFAVFIIAGTSNAVNITDGLDGLAIGLSLFAFLGYAGFSYVSGHTGFSEYLLLPHITTLNGTVGELTIICMALVGAGLGFLWYNAHPAEIFMGDTGALALGGALGVIALLVKQELVLSIVGGVFVIETISVFLQVLWYKMTGKRIFKMAPLHHHFELMGWKESKVIIRFWIMGVVCALIGLSTLKLR